MKKLLTIVLLSLALSASSQEKQTINASDYANQEVEMADRLRADGKIYVVVAVVLTLFVGLMGYMVVLDRKMSRLEKELKSKS